MINQLQVTSHPFCCPYWSTQLLENNSLEPLIWSGFQGCCFYVAVHSFFWPSCYWTTLILASWDSGGWCCYILCLGHLFSDMCQCSENAVPSLPWAGTAGTALCPVCPPQADLWYAHPFCPFLLIPFYPDVHLHRFPWQLAPLVKICPVILCNTI